MRRLLLQLAALILCILSFAPARLSASELESQIIRVYSHVQRPDYDAPWSSKSTERLSHMGIVVDQNHILVSAFAVTGARHFEAEKLGDNRRYPMRLAFTDHTVNLALLSFSGEKPPGLRPLAIGGDMSVGGGATMYQGLEGESLITSFLRLHEVEVRPLFISGYQVPHYVFELKRNGYGWFEPLIQDKKLLGAAIAQSGTTVYVLPARIIQRFLNAARRKPYRGFVELGFEIAPLIAPDQRKWSKADAQGPQFGAWVHSIKTSSAFFGKIHEGDVLLELNGTRVSSRGSYEHPRWGRISVLERLNQIAPGDKIRLKVLREGKLLTLEAKGQSFDAKDEKVAPDLGQQPDYFIFGGLLFQELSKELLESWGSHWRKRAPLPYVFEAIYHDAEENNKRLVVLQRVFPIDYNKGYHELEDNFVTEINGRAVHSLEEARQAFRDPEAIKSGFARLRLEPEAAEVVLSYAGLKQAHGTLQQRYGIPPAANFWQEDAGEP